MSNVNINNGQYLISLRQRGRKKTKCFKFIIMQNPQIKKYFPGLNGLRFAAAFLVIISHIEAAKHHHGYKNYNHLPFFASVGDLSVTLFFVLSGFLITYLLLEEKQTTRTINIKKFYIKRITRIWPLYFFVILITLFMIQKTDFFHLPQLPMDNFNKLGLKGLLLLIVFPNILTTFYFFTYFGHLWSIGVEEQFYLVWPWIIRFTKNYLRIFCIILLFFLTISLILFFAKIATNDPGILQSIKNIKSCVIRLRIGCMAVGGIGAWLIFYKKEKLLQLIYRKECQWATLFLLLMLFLTGPTIPLIKHEFYSLLFCILIINIASNPQVVLHLENKPLNFLGKISYGIYMYHPLIIGLIIGNLKQIKGFAFGNLLSDFILYTMVVSLTIAASAISYYLFENKFLRWGNNVS
jgi:peptidoglycan/LPS O-acetylase OafA/YrhL